jgi:hypothetical protein
MLQKPILQVKVRLTEPRTPRFEVDQRKLILVEDLWRATLEAGRRMLRLQERLRAKARPIEKLSAERLRRRGEVRV